MKLWWISEGVKIFKETIGNQLASSGRGAVHILPMSGGLDFRAVLGGLLEHIPSSQIVTVTYGIPGTWDFEIAKMISRKFGIQHVGY